MKELFQFLDEAVNGHNPVNALNIRTVDDKDED